jgi:hypothetical protein
LADAAAVVGCTQKRKLGCGANKRGRRKGGKERVFICFEKHSNIEFKPKFEFKHPKMMHQHVCNREFLYFFIKLRK